MQRRITDIFAELLRRGRGDDEEEQEGLVERQRERAHRQEQILMDFKNLKWTRVITM